MINYHLITKKSPKDGQKKIYASIVNYGKISIDDLAERISGSCTVTRTDCLAVLSALQREIVYALQSGNRVNLGDLGSMRITCTCKGVLDEKEFNLGNIKKLNVVFLPSVGIKEKLSLKRVTLNRLDLKEEKVVDAASVDPTVEDTPQV